MFGFWDVVVIAIACGCITEMFKAFNKPRNRGKSQNLEIFDRLDALEQSSETRGLEERVRTLEMIVTDRKTRLNDEINKL